MRLAAGLLPALLLAACARPGATPPAPPPYSDFSDAFPAFYDRTAGLDEEARLAAFKRDVAPLFPGFYAPRDGATQEQWDKAVNRAIADFPKVREQYEAVQRTFPAAYVAAKSHFARFFPGSTAALPTYFVHSLGEMDGGTRVIDGHNVMVFGADGMALYHTPEDLGPFFDHELFHVEHGAYFAECEEVWCALWIEGLATAASEVMNPGIGPAAMMLETPRPIAPEVDAHWREALCEIAANFESRDRDIYRGLFMGGGQEQRFPPRWGYYVGYRLAKQALTQHTLQELAHLRHAEAEKLVRRTFATMLDDAGQCH